MFVTVAAEIIDQFILLSRDQKRYQESEDNLENAKANGCLLFTLLLVPFDTARKSSR